VQYPANLAERENRWEIPALINARIWLGLEQHEHEWRRMQREGEVAVYAETVSNDTVHFITALHGMQTRSCDENSVRPSVRQMRLTNFFL